MLFDMDGTLLDLQYAEKNMNDVRDDLRGLFLEYGIDREFSPLLPTIADSLDELGRDTTQSIVEDVTNRAYARIEAADVYAARHQSIKVAARSLLDRLISLGIAVGVVTNNSRSGAVVALGTSGLPKPDVLVTRDDVKDVKPEPEMILTAIDRLNRPIDHFVMVGDRPSDALAAYRAAHKRGLSVETFLISKQCNLCSTNTRHTKPVQIQELGDLRIE